MFSEQLIYVSFLAPPPFLTKKINNFLTQSHYSHEIVVLLNQYAMYNKSRSKNSFK